MKKTIQTEQGQRLKLLRSQLLKLTQKRFSEIIETSSKSVTRYESGMSSIPDIVFTTIGYYYKEVNINWLKNGVGDILLKESEQDTVISGEPESVNWGINSDCESLLKIARAEIISLKAQLQHTKLLLQTKGKQ
jgi:transcriptional regulator with XRE-family HTH domain